MNWRGYNLKRPDKLCSQGHSGQFSAILTAPADAVVKKPLPALAIAWRGIKTEGPMAPGRSRRGRRPKRRRRLKSASQAHRIQQKAPGRPARGFCFSRLADWYFAGQFMRRESQK
jgi:hypothetical protein